MTLGRDFLSFILILSTFALSGGALASGSDDVVVETGEVATSDSQECGAQVAAQAAKPVFAKAPPPSAEVLFSADHFLSLSEMAARPEVNGETLQLLMAQKPFLRDIEPNHILDRIDIAIPVTESFPLNPMTLRNGVLNGYYIYYPYQQDNPFLRFEAPASRAVVKFSEMRKKLATSDFVKDVRKAIFGKGDSASSTPKMRVTFNKAFRQVIEGITRAKKRVINADKSPVLVNGRALRSEKTWVVDDVVKTYLASHEAGDAVSVEVWIDLPNASGQMEPVLAGGVIGLSIDGIYSGETLYMNEAPNPLNPGKLIGDGAGKVAMLAFFDYLESQEVEFVDVQTVNESTGRIGANYVDRSKEYLKLIEAARSCGVRVRWPEGDYNVRLDYWSKANLQKEHVQPKKTQK